MIRKLLNYYNRKKSFQKLKSIGEGTIIEGGVILEYPENIIIGEYSRIGPNSRLNALGKIFIGNNVIMGPNITLWTANHNYDNENCLPFDNEIIKKPIIIEDNVWIGANVNIVPGVRISEGSVIGMGAVVTKDVPYCSIVGGNPAVVLKYRNIAQYEVLKSNKKYFLKEL